MISVRNNLVGKINNKVNLTGKIFVSKINVYPELEDLTITPTKDKQTFNHKDSYGYDNVVVEPIPSEYIIPDGTLDIESNGDIDVSTFKTARVGVHTPPTLQDKSITITENGTQNITFDDGYEGLNNVEVITNIESGGGAINITTTTEITNVCRDAMTSFVDYINNVPNTFDVYTDEPITLYSPAEGYTKYVIRYRTSGQYCVVWFPDTVMCLRAINGSTFSPGYPYVQGFSSKSTFDNKYFAIINTEGATGYTYSSHSTIDKCIEAMKNPNTSYGSSTNSSNWGFDSQDTGYFFPMTNLPCFDVNNVLQNGRKISSNETIVFKQ